MDGKVQPPQHQVFINFRGEELRYNFISHLVDALERNGINFFIDKQEQMGENISNLFNRIKDSKIALAVFSERYTESRWCLDELVKISERADLGELKVLPIFYKVPTESVKQLVGEFGDHFRRREWEYRSEQPRIDRWKKALASVSGKIGMTFDGKSLSESDFIVNIVNNVLILLQAINTNSPVNKLQESGETSSVKRNSKKSLKAQKGNLVSQPKAEIIRFTGSNSLAPQIISSGHSPNPVQGHSPNPVQGRNITIQFSQATPPANALRIGVPPVQVPHNVVHHQPSHASGFTGTRPPYDGFPVRYGNHENRGRGETSSMPNNTKKKPNKSPKSNLEFTGTNGWIS